MIHLFFHAAFLEILLKVFDSVHCLASIENSKSRGFVYCIALCERLQYNEQFLIFILHDVDFLRYF